MNIQSPAPEIHRIVERFIATVTVDQIEWDCYGTASDKCSPEIIQIALHGSQIDLYYKISHSTISSIETACSTLWLDGAFDNSEFFRSLNRG